jgi:hypothetical protein
MAFSEKAINALSNRRIKPFAEIETKLSSEDISDPWHKINFTHGRLVSDANEMVSELTFRALDRNSFAVDQYRDDSSDTNYLRTGSQIRLKIGISYIDDGEEITEYRIAFDGLITRINPFVEEGFWGVEITSHDRMIRASQAVAAIDLCADIAKVTNEQLVTLNRIIYKGVNPNWISGMVVVSRTVNGETHEVQADEYQVLECAGGIEFYDEQDQSAQIYADYYFYDGSSLNVTEVIKAALEYPSESGGMGLSSEHYDLVNTSQANPDESQRLPLVRFQWNEADGGPIEIYNYLLNSGIIPSNLKFWYDSEEFKYRLQFIYQKDLENPKTPDFEPDFEVVRSIAFDDPADSEELYTRVIVTGHRHAPENLARNASINVYEFPLYPGWNASFKAPSEIEGAVNKPENVRDGSVNTQYMWILGDKVGEDIADGAIMEGTQNTSLPEFDENHPYNRIAPMYLDLGELKKPSRVALHIGSNRFGSDRNPGRPPMLVSIEIAQSLTNPDDMHDPGWIPLSAQSFRFFSDANRLVELDRKDFLVNEFKYIRVLFHFGLYYKWKPERRFIEYPIREIAVFEDDRITGTDQVSMSRYPVLYQRYIKRGFRTYIHDDPSLQTQDEVNERAIDLLDELVRNYLDRETMLAWDPRYKLHKESTVSLQTAFGLTISETDPRYEKTSSRLITRIEYDLDNFIVRISGTDYFTEAE